MIDRRLLSWEMMNRAPITYLVVGLSLMVHFILVWQTSGRSDISSDEVRRTLLAGLPHHFWAGGWHHPLTNAFHHGGWIHLLFNSFAMLSLGVFAEIAMGSRVVALFLFTCFYVCSLCCIAIGQFAIGISGGLFGLYFFMLKARHRWPMLSGIAHQQNTKLLLGWFGICVFLSVTGQFQVSNMGHGAGLVFGYLLGWILFDSRPGRVRWIAGLGFVLALVIVLCAAINPVWLDYYQWFVSRQS